LACDTVEKKEKLKRQKNERTWEPHPRKVDLKKVYGLTLRFVDGHGPREGYRQLYQVGKGVYIKCCGSHLVPTRENRPVLFRSNNVKTAAVYVKVNEPVLSVKAGGGKDHSPLPRQDVDDAPHGARREVANFRREHDLSTNSKLDDGRCYTVVQFRFDGGRRE
jgi:hypothetical protein